MSWTPTHAQVTVHRARNLIPKGKGGTNDAFVTIQLGKEKYQTSVKERAENPEWHEECDLPIPDSPSAVHLNLYHRNFIGLDDFLGHISLPVDEFQIYERPRSKWYPLKSKPGKKNDHKYRGEIEVKVTFIVQSKSGSQTSLSKKIKRTPSIKAVANAVGEKLKLPNRSKSFRTDSKTDLYQEKKPPSAFVEPLVNAHPSLPSVAILPELAAAPSVEQHDVTKDADLSKQLRRSKSGSDDHSPEEADSLIHMRQPVYKAPTLRRAASDADAKFVDFSGRKRMGSAQENSETPLLTDAREMARSLGCLKEETDSAFMPNNWKSDVNGRQTSQSASASSSRLNGNSNNLKNKSSQENLNSSEAKLRDSTERLKRMKDPTRRHTLQGVELPALLTHDLHQGVGREIRPKDDRESLPPEVIDQYRDLSREELIKMIWLQKSLVEQKNNVVHELENYIDNLLVRVMETSPRILQNPYERPSTPIQRTPSKHMTRATKISTNPLRRLQSLRLRSSKRH